MRKFLYAGPLLGMLLLAGCGSGADTPVQASGQIQAKEVNVASELTGRVLEVVVDEGDTVQAGDVLFRLEGTLLEAERRAAEADAASARAAVRTAQNALDTARAEYQRILEQVLAQDEATRLQDWFKQDPKQFEQPGWYFSRQEQIDGAQIQVDLAAKQVEGAQRRLEALIESASGAAVTAAEQRLLQARLAYSITQEVRRRAANSTTSDEPVGRFNLANCGKNDRYVVDPPQLTNVLYPCVGNVELKSAGNSMHDAAERELDDAQAEYDEMLGTQAADDVLQARADVAVARERYYTALDVLRSLQTGDQAPEVRAAEGAVKQAEAILDQAESAAEAAQARLDLIAAQIEKLTVRAPTDGVVLVRSVEAGEIQQATAPALTIGQLDQLKVTVYIPEGEYGRIHVGDAAMLEVDSFADATFSAKVARIADRAEYTPQNVQTKEGRQTTVYAVELSVENPDGKLKPGMPTDVTFRAREAGT